MLRSGLLHFRTAMAPLRCQVMDDTDHDDELTGLHQLLHRLESGQMTGRG